MIRHIVMFKFKEETTEAQIQEIQDDLNALMDSIDDLESMECGIDIVGSERSYDFALISVFEDLDALDRYAVHPEHQRVVSKIKIASSQVTAVDYEF